MVKRIRANIVLCFLIISKRRMLRNSRWMVLLPHKSLQRRLSPNQFPWRRKNKNDLKATCSASWIKFRLVKKISDLFSLSCVLPFYNWERAEIKFPTTFSTTFSIGTGSTVGVIARTVMSAPSQEPAPVAVIPPSIPGANAHPENPVKMQRPFDAGDFEFVSCILHSSSSSPFTSYQMMKSRW